MATADDEGRRL